MNVLYLTMNPNRASTTVPTEGWFRLLRPLGLNPVVVSRTVGAFHEWAASEGIPAYHQKLPWPSKLWPWPFFWSLWKLRRLVKRHRIQLIHCNEQDVYPTGQYLGRLCDLPVVVSVHFTMPRPFCRWAFHDQRQPRRILFISPGNLEACRRGVVGIIPESSWRLIPNGLDLERYRPCDEQRARFRRQYGLDDHPVIGVACALRPRKQLEHLFQAASRLSDPRLRVVVAGSAVAGDEAYADALLRQAKETLGERLIYVGHLDELRGFYNALDVFVNTSQEEACSISVLEALACGCPVVGYPSRSVDGQVLPGGGEIVAQNRVDLLTDALAGWLSEPRRLAEGRAGARKRVEAGFDIRTISEELYQEYENLIGEGRHAGVTMSTTAVSPSEANGATCEARLSLGTHISTRRRGLNESDALPPKKDAITNVLFLTNNANLGSTARILQSWLLLGPAKGVLGNVIATRAGDLTNWLSANSVDYVLDPMPWPDWRWPLTSLSHAWKVARLAKCLGTDVIHCNEHDVYPFAALVRQILRLPLVCHVRYKVERGFCEWAFGGWRRPDALLWTSRQQRDDCAAAVEGVVPDHVQHIVPLGIDLSQFGALASGREATRSSWGFRPDEIVLGMASALRPHKRIEDFISIVSKLAQHDERVVGVLAGDAMPGDEGYREQLLRQIEMSGLGRRLRWVGNLEPVEPFYHAIDIFVSTSSYETFGNSVCEAMACRRPVAAYRGGSVQEVVGSAGRIVETGNIDALTEVVSSLVRQPQLRLELGELGCRRVNESFNPASSLVQLQTIYDALLATRSGGELKRAGHAARPGRQRNADLGLCKGQVSSS